ncbi:B-cell receptor CD22-like isoform X1, partial [Clarias magur]
MLEGSSVILTCSSDSNPPVEIYTWFKVNESSAVGSGQSYRALQSGQYYCQAQNKHGSERSAAASINFKGGSVIVYVSVGIGTFGFAALLSTLFWPRCKRQKKKADEGFSQMVGLNGKDDTYATLDPTGQASDDVYQTPVISQPSPPDTLTSPEYENIAMEEADEGDLQVSYYRNVHQVCALFMINSYSKDLQQNLLMFLHPSSLQNAGPSAKDDTYAALDPAGRETSDDVYHTLAVR